MTALSSLIITGNTDITANAGVFDFTNQNIRIGGRLYVYSNSVETGPTLISANSTVIFNGALAQNIYNSNSNPMSFNNIVFTGTGLKQFGYNGLPPASNVVDVNGDFTIDGASVRGDGWNYGVDFLVAGDWNNTGTFTHGGAGRLVTFDGTDQSISSSNFSSMNFTNSGTKTINGNLTISGNVTLSGTATVDPNSFNMNITGNWDNSAAGSIFLGNSGAVIFEGGGTSTITTGTTTGILAGKGFYNITINKTGNASLAGDFEVKNDFSIPGGTFYTQGFDMWVGGNFQNTAGNFSQNNNLSLLTLNATGGTKIFDPGINAMTTYPLRGITVNAPGTTYNVANNFIINQNQDFTLNDGTFDLNGHNLQLNTNNQRIVINGGTFNIGASATLTFNGTAQTLINQGGTLRLVGTSTNIAIINRLGGTYTISQTSGVIHAGNYKFDYPSGITITGGTIDATNNFSEGTFSSGTGNAYLTLTGWTFSDFTVSNVVFNSGPTYNVSRTSGLGTISFADATGTLSGENFDQDNGIPGTLVNWSNIGGYYWDGGAGTDNWNDAANWSGNLVPDATSNVILDHSFVAAAYTVRIRTANANASRVVLDTKGGTAIILQLEGGYDLDVNGSMIINTNTTVNIISNTSTINVAGNWSNSGTFNHGNSTVTFDGANGYFTIATGGTAVGKKFYNFSINATGSTYALTATLDADNNVDITKGTLDLASPLNDVWVGGNWNVNNINGGIFIPNQADVTFDGTNQTINNGPFYNFITATSGTKTLLSNLAINSSVTIGASTIFNGQDKNITVATNWTNNGGTFNQTGLGTVNFNGIGGQQIDNAAATATSFNYLIFSNGGGKTINKSITVTGDLIINPGSGLVDVLANQITGNGSNSLITGNNTTLRLRGANNFPNNFAVINLSSSSTIEYLADIDQTIRVSPTWAYGNLRITDMTNTLPSYKRPQAGDLTITGNLYISNNSSAPTTPATVYLDMAANSSNMILTGTIDLPTGAPQIVWGTGTTTLTHVGGDWGIDKDITGFNNINFNGYGYKWMYGDLAITGNVLIKNGVRLYMQEGWGPPPVPHAMSGLAGKSFTLENGAYLVCPVADITSPAFPYNFGTYFLGDNSYTILNGYVPQIVYTGNGIVYGNLDLGGYGRTVVMDGISNLIVKGYFTTNYATLSDAGKNISVAGSYAYLDYFTPSPGTTFTLNGNINQVVYDVLTNVPTSSNLTLDFANVVFAGYGTKTFGDGNDVININGNVSISNGVTVTSGRNIAFNGLSWTNLGVFQHTGGTITFDNASNQTIDAGPFNANNYFNNAIFSNSNNKLFVNHGADFNGSITINSGTVTFGAYNVYVAGNIINNTGGILTTPTTNFFFDGGNQNINTLPTLDANNVTMSTNGTKRMFSNWNINGNLTINNLVALNTCPVAAPVPPYYDINIKGNWTNNGTYTSNTSKVTFNGSTSPISITTNGSAFYDVDFVPTSNVQYNLMSTSSRISHAMNLNAASTLNLNSNTLFLGSNIAAGKLYTVQGKLIVNENANLKFNNQTSQAVMNVTGSLQVVGSSPTNIATISRETAGVAGSESQINIQAGGSIAARYYLIEYLQDAGLNVMSGSTLDAINNFSDGTFSNIRTNAGINTCYINLEASSYSGGSISNICFNFSGTPTVNQHFNVRRNVSSPTITFANVSGNLGSYLYEDDDLAPSATAGLLRWPALTNTSWIGGVSTDWHNPANWSGGVPTSTLDAIIPKGLPYDPHIYSADANCKKLQITTGRLSLDNFSLITTSDIQIGGAGANNGILAVSNSASEIVCGGFWTCGASGMFVHGNGTVRFVSSAGSATITPLASSFYNIVLDNSLTTFYLVGGSPTALVIKGSVTIKYGTLTPVTNNYNYNVFGDFVVENGTFTPIMGAVTAGTVNMTGSSSQNITNVIFYNLNIAGSGTTATHGVVIINNNTTVSSILKAESGSNIDFNGNVTITASGTFNDGDEIHTFTGSIWTGTGDYSGNGTILFDRLTSDQTINASKFNNMDVACTSRNLILAGDVSITGDITTEIGVANLYVNNYHLNTASSMGSFSVLGTTGIIITGADNFPDGFSNYNLSLTSTSYYRGTIDQLIAGVNYGILTLQNANTKTLKGDIGIQNTLNFNNSTLDVSNNNYNIAISGTWNNASTGTFIPRNAEVVFEGIVASQPISVSATAINPFWDLTINKPSGTAYTASAVTYTIQDNLKVSLGRFSANGRPVNVGNDLIALSGTIVQSGTFIMTKASGNANVQSNGSIFNNFTVNAGAGATITSLDNMRVDGNFTVQSGIFDGNSKHNVLGYSNNTISISGTYKVGAGGTLEIGYYCGLTVNNGGTIEIIGAPGNAATVTRNVNNWYGSYRFTVDGTIRANYALFEYMGLQTTGIYITSNGTIDPINNFSNCTFTNGSNNGAMLTIENTQTLSGANAITDVSFPINPAGSSRNVRKIVSTSGTVEFYNAIGVFAGENFDDDPLNLINWTGPIYLTWNGSISTDWNDPNNWTASSGLGFVPTGAENVFIAVALNQPILTTFGASTAHLTINSGATLTLNTPMDGAANDLTVNGDLTILGTIRLITSSDYLAVKGNWVRSGITNLNGNIVFNGSGSSKVINNGNSPFYNLIIGGSAQYKLSTGTIIKNNVTINPGAYLEIPANSQLFVAGSWNNNGTFNPQTGKVVFNSISGIQTLNGGISPFYDIDINAGGAYQLLGTVSINRNLNLYGSLDLNSQILNGGDGVGTDYINVNSGGVLNISANSNLRMGASSYIQVNSGAILNVLGTDDSNLAEISHQTAGTYALDIMSGGILDARYYTIDYLNTNGLFMHSGALLDATNNLSDGTFSQGSVGGTFLKFENNFGGNITLANVVFNSGALNNVTSIYGTDIITMRDAAGSNGTFLSEKDITGLPDPNSGLILWTYVNSFIWTGAIDHNWHNPGNWMTNIVPDITKSAIVPDMTNDPIVSTATAQVKKLTLYAGATLDINNQNFTAASDITNDGTISTIGSPQISVGGTWNGTTGAFNSGSSKVIFNGTGGNKILNIGVGNFYDFDINAGLTSIYQFANAVAIRGSVNIVSGTLDGSAFDLTVGGGWNATGSFIPGLKTVTFNAASGNYTINNGTNKFYNCIVYSGNGTGNALFALSSALTILNDYTLRKGTFDLSNDAGVTSKNLTINNRFKLLGGTMLGRAATITVGENWQISSPGVFTCGTSNVILTSASGIRSIAPALSPFYNLNVNTASTYRISNNLITNNTLLISNGVLDASASPSYNITVAGNWIDNGTFSSRTGTVTFNGITQSITKAVGESFYNLGFTNNTNITLASGNVVATNAINLNSGTITTGSNKLILGTNVLNPGSLIYTAGKIIGKFERWLTATGTNYLFPVGYAAQAEPITMRSTSGLTAGSVITEFIPTDPGSTGLPLTESGATVISSFSTGYWNLVAANGFACTNYNITLQANGFDPTYTNIENRIIKRINGGNWTLDGTHSLPSIPTFYRNNCSGISTSGTQFGLGIIDCKGGSVAINQSICSGQTFTPLTNSTMPIGGNGLYTYTWQYSTNSASVPGDGSWTNIPLSNTPGLTFGSLSTKTFFVRKANATGCIGDHFSNIITIIVTPLPATGPLYHLPNM